LYFEAETGTFLTVCIWLVSIALIAASIYRFRSNKGGSFFLIFSILQSLSLFMLKDLLLTVETNEVMASEENTLRLYLFVFPWLFSFVFLVFGILRDSKKENSVKG
jgi:hypothetical protein